MLFVPPELTGFSWLLLSIFSTMVKRTQPQHTRYDDPGFPDEWSNTRTHTHKRYERPCFFEATTDCCLLILCRRTFVVHGVIVTPSKHLYLKTNVGHVCVEDYASHDELTQAARARRRVTSTEQRCHTRGSKSRSRLLHAVTTHRQTKIKSGDAIFCH